MNQYQNPKFQNSQQPSISRTKIAAKNFPETKKERREGRYGANYTRTHPNQTQNQSFTSKEEPKKVQRKEEVLCPEGRWSSSAGGTPGEGKRESFLKLRRVLLCRWRAGHTAVPNGIDRISRTRSRTPTSLSPSLHTQIL